MYRRLRISASCLLVLALFLGFCPTTADELQSVVDLLELVLDSDPKTAQSCLAVVFQKIEVGELDARQVGSLRPRLQPKMQTAFNQGRQNPLYLDAATLLGLWGDRPAVSALEAVVLGKSSDADRLRALSGLVMIGEPSVTKMASTLLRDVTLSTTLKGQLITVLGNHNAEQIGSSMLDLYRVVDRDLQPRIVELLTTRPQWSKQLLASIDRKILAASDVNENQVRRMLLSRDDELIAMVGKTWGAIRLERNPDRDRTIREVRLQLRAHLGDAQRGKAVFTRVCAQCHKIYGEGQEVGPDLTSNGRSSFDQLLSNVLDPSLVIGASYQARIVVTESGRLLTGLPIEDNDDRVVLKVQGGKIESIPRSEIEEISVSKLSMMPEGLEKQLTMQELVDLFWFLCLDRQPADPAGRLIPGTSLRTE